MEPIAQGKRSDTLGCRIGAVAPCKGKSFQPALVKSETSVYYFLQILAAATTRCYQFANLHKKDRVVTLCRVFCLEQLPLFTISTPLPAQQTAKVVFVVKSSVLKVLP